MPRELFPQTTLLTRIFLSSLRVYRSNFIHLTFKSFSQFLASSIVSGDCTRPVQTGASKRQILPPSPSTTEEAQTMTTLH